MGIPAHVPFQDLIDSAIMFIGRVPPRKLLALAMRYFDPQQAEPMVQLYPSITTFYAPPAWSLAGTAKADWVLKQRTRERHGLTPTSRKDRKLLVELRRRHVPNMGGGEPSDKNASSKEARDADDSTTIGTPETVEQMAKKLKWPKAMVALGFGPGEDEVVRQRKRRKLLLVGGAATVAVFAIVVGVALRYRAQSPTPNMEKPASNNGFLLTQDDSLYGKSRATSARPASAHINEITLNTDSCEVKGVKPVGLGPQPDVSKASSLAADRTTLAVLKGNETLVQNYFQRIVVKQFQLVYAKLRSLIRTVEFLRATVADPGLRDNLQKILSGSFEKLSRTIKNPDNLAHVPANAARVSQKFGRFASKACKSALVWATKHLGGDNLEELELGV
jgi:hypothetical protein